MFSTMVAVAEGLIDEVLEGVTQDNTMSDSSTSSNEDSEHEIEAGTQSQISSPIKTWELQHYVQLAKTTRAKSALVQRILRTVSYVFTDHYANVVGLVLHYTEWGDDDTVHDIISLHRKCILLLIRIWEKDFGSNIEISVQHVPHKKKTLQEKNTSLLLDSTRSASCPSYRKEPGANGW